MTQRKIVIWRSKIVLVISVSILNENSYSDNKTVKDLL